MDAQSALLKVEKIAKIKPKFNESAKKKYTLFSQQFIGCCTKLDTILCDFEKEMDFLINATASSTDCVFLYVM